jgi:hypothetical protein
MARREFLSDGSGQSRDSTLILFRTASFEVADGIPPGGLMVVDGRLRITLSEAMRPRYRCAAEVVMT